MAVYDADGADWGDVAKAESGRIAEVIRTLVVERASDGAGIQKCHQLKIHADVQADLHAAQDGGSSADRIARKAMEIAASICVYTNGNLTVETIRK